MITFCQPCLQWKLWLAYKTHWGFPGVSRTPVPGYTTRYLTKSVHYVQINHFSGGVNQPVADLTDITSIDRITGVRTLPPNGGTFPDPTGTIGVDPRWVINSDSSATIYVFTPFNPFAPSQGGYSVQYDVELSSPHTTAQLEQDVDALMSAIDPSTIPAMNLKQVFYPADAPYFLGAADAAGQAIPGAYLYDAIGGINQQLSFQPKLKAAAFTAYIPASGDVVDLTFRPGLVKLTSRVAMAGDYCLKTFMVDYLQNPAGTPQCVSGKGTCNGWFDVSPPALASGVNTYKLVVPDCRCGG